MALAKDSKDLCMVSKPKCTQFVWYLSFWDWSPEVFRGSSLVIS